MRLYPEVRLRLRTATGTTVVVSELPTEPPSFVIAEIARDPNKVQRQLGGNCLALELQRATAELGPVEKSLTFEEPPLHGQLTNPLTSHGTPTIATHMGEGGGYGEAAIVEQPPDSSVLGTDFAIAVVRTATAYAAALRPGL